MTKILLTIDNIAEQNVDAIVNSAHTSLLAGSGLCGAIHKAAGKELEKECLTIGSCGKGEAVITKGYKLPAKYVIHTVGPRYGLERKSLLSDEQILTNCYINSLKRAKENNVRTIAFPSIATNIYCYPIEQASKIALSTIKSFLKENNNEQCFDAVYIVLYSEKDLNAYKSMLSSFSCA